ncbi:MAG: RNase A-like domain-containing protein [Acidobacteriota bacterium]
MLLALALLACTGPSAPAASPEAAPGRQAAVAATPRDLSRDEREGGHTLGRHVGLSEEELRQRLRRERHITAASSWYDRATAERVVGSVLASSRERIEAWLARSGPRPNLVLDYRGSPSDPIGRGLRRGGRGARPACDAVVVLKWAGGYRFFVLTAYPEVRR